MAIVKTVMVDKIELLVESGVVQVRCVTRITEDGVTLAESFHRHTVSPGQDYSTECAEVQAACASLHTPEKIAAYQAAQQESAV